MISTAGERGRGRDESTGESGDQINREMLENQKSTMKANINKQIKDRDIHVIIVKSIV